MIEAMASDQAHIQLFEVSQRDYSGSETGEVRASLHAAVALWQTSAPPRGSAPPALR